MILSDSDLEAAMKAMMSDRTTASAVGLRKVRAHIASLQTATKAGDPIFTITGTIVDIGDLEHGRGLVIGKSSKPVTILGLSQDELIAMRMAFADEVTLTVTPVTRQTKKHKWRCEGSHGAERWICDRCGASNTETWKLPPETPCLAANRGASDV